jgi:hypothetical protein
MTKEKILVLLNSPWRLWWYLLLKLPGAWFMGVRLRACDGQKAEVRLPYRWRSQNPFRSTYFAAQCAAGEFSTGVLCLYALAGEAPVSMLVTQVRAEFYKKADQTLLFTCTMGPEIQAAVRQTLATGEPVSIEALSVGTLPNGVEAARVWITWSLKRKAGPTQ